MKTNSTYNSAAVNRELSACTNYMTHSQYKAMLKRHKPLVPTTRKNRKDNTNVYVVGVVLIFTGMAIVLNQLGVVI